MGRFGYGLGGEMRKMVGKDGEKWWRDCIFVVSNKEWPEVFILKTFIRGIMGLLFFRSFAHTDVSANWSNFRLCSNKFRCCFNKFRCCSKKLRCCFNRFPPFFHLPCHKKNNPLDDNKLSRDNIKKEQLTLSRIGIK